MHMCRQDSYQLNGWRPLLEVVNSRSGSHFGKHGRRLKEQLNAQLSWRRMSEATLGLAVQQWRTLEAARQGRDEILSLCILQASHMHFL